MTPIDKLKRAIDLLEEDEDGLVPPFEYWIDLRMADLWTAIKTSEHYPERLINEWAFLERMKKQWQDELI